jgi:hypothetical protein
MPDIELVPIVIPELLVAPRVLALCNEDQWELLSLRRDCSKEREVGLWVTIDLLMHCFYSPLRGNFFTGHDEVTIGLVRIRDRLRRASVACGG